VSLKDKLYVLSILLLVFMAILGASASLRGTLNADPNALSSSSNSQAIDDANAEFKRALNAVREAEAAGADRERIAVLVERLNLVLGMMDEAKRLMLQGNNTEADAIARRTIYTSRGIISEAIELRDETSSRAYYENMFTFGMAPVASLLVTVGAHYGWKLWRRSEAERIMRMEIKKIKEAEEE